METVAERAEMSPGLLDQKQCFTHTKDLWAFVANFR